MYCFHRECGLCIVFIGNVDCVVFIGNVDCVLFS